MFLCGFGPVDLWPVEHLFFFEQPNDRTVGSAIEDSNGTIYTYRVYKQFQIEPTEAWVMEPVEGKSIATLQTCCPHYTWEHRLVVRGELVDVSCGPGVEQ